MYDRPSAFEVLPAMADLGPVRVVMQPWYDLAEIALNEGDEARATTIYHAILAYAPDEQDAAMALDELLQVP